jgi:hypothetical protein
MSRDRPMYTGGGQPVYIGRRVASCSRIPVDSLRSEALRPRRATGLVLLNEYCRPRLTKPTTLSQEGDNQPGHRVSRLQTTVPANAVPKAVVSDLAVGAGGERALQALHHRAGDQLCMTASSVAGICSRLPTRASRHRPPRMARQAA